MVVTDLDIKVTALKSDEAFVFEVEIELDSISVVGLFVWKTGYQEAVAKQ